VKHVSVGDGPHPVDAVAVTSGSPFVDCIEPVDERAPRRTGWSSPLERRALGTGIRRALDDIMCSPPRYTPSRCSAVQTTDRRVRGGDLRDGFPIETIRYNNIISD